MGLTIARQDYLFVQLYKAYTRWSIRNPKRRALSIPCFASYPKVLKASPAIDISKETGKFYALMCQRRSLLLDRIQLLGDRDL